MTLEDKIRELVELRTPPNEEDAKNHLIQPILRLLGWASDDPRHVAFEHQVGDGRVDIALRGQDDFVAFVEAKAPGRPLDNAVQQVLKYAFLGGVDICVLTTGIEWWLYLPREKGALNKRRFAVLNIDKNSPDVVAAGLRRYLSRSALESGSAEGRAKEALAAIRDGERIRAEIPKVWDEMMRKPDPALIALVRRKVLSKTKLEATESLVTEVNSLVAEVIGTKNRRQVMPTGTGVSRVPPAAEAGGTRQRSGPAARGLARTQRTPRATSFHLWGIETPVRSWRDVVVGVIQALERRHGDGFLEAAQALWGTKRPWISDDQTQIKRSRPIPGTGLHAFVNLTAVDCEERCIMLLEHFGHDGKELTIR